ncbi:hypothetical protein FRB90_009817, partial [Tulasnella sp. 427]
MEKKIGDKETDRGIALAPSPKDLRPWYAEKSEGDKAVADPSPSKLTANDRSQRKDREMQRKALYDPMNAVQTQLLQRSQKNPSNSLLPSGSKKTHQNGSKQAGLNNAREDPLLAARLSRETAERARAEAVI